MGEFYTSIEWSLCVLYLFLKPSKIHISLFGGVDFWGCGRHALWSTLCAKVYAAL